MATKRRRLDQDNDEENAETTLKETLIYIVPKKIPKARLQVLHNLAQKKGLPLSENYRFVH